MPIVPLLAIAGAAVAGTVAGVGIAAAGITAITAFEVVAAVGATIGAIGVVSRDKTLSTVGLAIGAIGGIGGLASSAGLLGSAAASDAPLFGAAPAASTADTGSAFGAAASDASSAATYGPTSAFATGDAAGASTAATEAGTGLAAPLATANTGSDGTINFMADLDQQARSNGVVSLNDTAQNAADPAVALPGPRADGTGLLNNAPTDPNAPTAPGLTGPGNSAARDLQAEVSTPDSFTGKPPGLDAGPPPSGGDVNSITGQVNQGAIDPITGKISSLPDSSSGIGGAVSGILDFAKKNPVVALGALQAAGSFLSGATSTLTPAQVAAYNAQAAANQAAAALTAQQTRNLAAPKAVASLAPVTGAPGPLIPPTANPLAPQVQLPGLINNAPPRLAPVTGVPA